MLEAATKLELEEGEALDVTEETGEDELEV